VAGKRAGLEGERFGLFMEQIRVIREMREATHGKKPRYMLWENVPGALTSKKGEDFRAVLEETVRIADPEANIPRPPAGRWPHAGCIVGDGYSLAYRILNLEALSGCAGFYSVFACAACGSCLGSCFRGSLGSCFGCCLGSCGSCCGAVLILFYCNFIRCAVDSNDIVLHLYSS
jgi:hypothetical protein